MHKHPHAQAFSCISVLSVPFPFPQVCSHRFSAHLDKRNSCKILVSDLCPPSKSLQLRLWNLPAAVASSLVLPARRVKLGCWPVTTFQDTDCASRDAAGEEPDAQPHKLGLKGYGVPV